MKTYLVKFEQYIYGLLSDPCKVIIPKNMTDKNSIEHDIGLDFVEYLHTLDSELDLVYISQKNITDTPIINSDFEIQYNFNYFEEIAYLDDGIVKSLGYKPSKLNLKMTICKGDGDYYWFKDRYSIRLHDNEKIAPMCKELFDKKYVNAIILSIGTKIIELNDDSDQIYDKLDSRLQNTKKDIDVKIIKFNKVFNRYEANDLLRILLQCIPFPAISIERVELLDLYELV